MATAFLCRNAERSHDDQDHFDGNSHLTTMPQQHKKHPQGLYITGRFNSSNPGNQCNDKTSFPTTCVLQEFPTRTLQTNSTDAVVNPLLDDNDYHHDLTHLHVSTTIIGNATSPTSLTPPSCNNNSFGQTMELEALAAGCKWLTQCLQVQS